MPLRAEASLRLSPSCRLTASTGELLATFLHLLPRMGRRGCSAGLRGGQSTAPPSGEVPWCARDQGPPGLETSYAPSASVASPLHTHFDQITFHPTLWMDWLHQKALHSLLSAQQPETSKTSGRLCRRTPQPDWLPVLCRVSVEVPREAHRVLAQWVPVHPTLLATAVPSCPLHSPWLSALLGTRSP